MGRERREQGRGKIRVGVEVLMQLRDAQIFRAQVRTAEAKRGFTPIVNHERSKCGCLGDVTGRIVVNNLHQL